MKGVARNYVYYYSNSHFHFISPIPQLADDKNQEISVAFLRHPSQSRYVRYMARANSSGLCINDVLSNDELTEIFLRIDPMDLFRCKLVCKRWLSCTGNEEDFVAPFILRRSKEPPPLCVDKGDDHETIHLKWSRSERVLLNPTWYCLSFRKFSSILHRNHRLRCCSDYFDKDLSSTIVGSSNGLLLVSGFGSSPGRYCICNPITKHWLELPPFTSSRSSRSFNLQVGFITDPFYELWDDNCSVSVKKGISAKVVRLDFARYNGNEKDGQVDVEVFSSDTGSNSVKGCYSYILQRGIDSFTMHPTNIMMGYISVLNIMIECDFDSRTMTPIIDLVGPDGESPSCDDFAVLLPICLPIWPTPLPLLPNAA
ncbi:hypothetical protein LINGRAHAP2_LOCUS17733 [Linum grandiflorum]